MIALSVISSSSARRASAVRVEQRRASSSASSASSRLRADRLTATVSSIPASRQRRALRAAPASSTQQVSGRIRPVCSASGMNSLGRDQPAVGVLPAHQRLDADERAACERRPWAGSAGSARRARSPGAARRAAPALGRVVVERRRRRPRSRGRCVLGDVHRDVGALQQRRQSRRAREQRDADADADARARMPSIDERLARSASTIRSATRARRGTSVRARAAARRTRRRRGGPPCRPRAARRRRRWPTCDAAAGRRRAWPRVSLTSLKRSRSSSSTATPRPTAWRRRAPARCGRRAGCRFGRPVSASCSARRSSSACCALRSEMSRSIAMPTHRASTCMRLSATSTGMRGRSPWRDELAEPPSCAQAASSRRCARPAAAGSPAEPTISPRAGRTCARQTVAGKDRATGIEGHDGIEAAIDELAGPGLGRGPPSRHRCARCPTLHQHGGNERHHQAESWPRGCRARPPPMTEERRQGRPPGPAHRRAALARAATRCCEQWTGEQGGEQRAERAATRRGARGSGPDSKSRMRAPERPVAARPNVAAR